MTLAEMAAADRRARDRHRYRLSLVVLVIAAVVAALLLWRDLRDDRPHAKAGVVTETADLLPAQWRRTVLVPGTRYDVTAAVRDDLADDSVDADVRAHQAPDGGVFVGLRVAVSGAPGPVVPDANPADFDVAADPAFTLIADGRRVALPVNENREGTPTRLPANVWVAVAGAGDRLTLETSWEGRTQRIDLRSGARSAGSFATLYRERGAGDDPAAPTSCGAATWTPGWRAGPGVQPACSYRVDRVAWSAEKGWAPSGRQWLALTTTLSAPSYLIHRVGAADLTYSGRLVSSSATSYDVAESPDRLDGRPPAALRKVVDPREDDTAVLVFDVPAAAATHTAVVTQSTSVRSRTNRSDANYYRNGVRQTWTIRLG